MIITDDQLIHNDVDVLDSLRLPTGLTLAAPGAAYDRIWIRDNCYLGLAYWHAGERERALKLFRGLLKIIDRYTWKIDWILWEGKPAQSYKRLHPRYDANGFEIPEHWGFIQNDAIGLLLWCTAWLEEHGAKILTPHNLHLIQKLVWYLAAIRYWDDADNGVWEEIDEIHASSLGCCIAGLKGHRSRVMVPEDAIAQGERVLAELKGRESFERYIDMAQLTLVWPLGIQDEETVRLIERELLRKKGVIRYIGDAYHSGCSEAEWTMGLPWLGLCWLSLGDIARARSYMEWTDRVRAKGLLPEAYITSKSAGEIIYTPCDHTPLGWSHALALILRQQLAGHKSQPVFPAAPVVAKALPLGQVTPPTNPNGTGPASIAPLEIDVALANVAETFECPMPTEGPSGDLDADGTRLELEPAREPEAAMTNGRRKTSSRGETAASGT